MNLAVFRAVQSIVRDVLREVRCGSCAGPIDGRAHAVELHGPNGECVAQFFCVGCVQEAIASPQGARTVARRGLMRLSQAGEA